MDVLFKHNFGTCCNNSIHLRGIDGLYRVINPSKLFLSPYEKGSTLKGKNLLPVGENSFFFE